jgi:hypothetical protein
MEQLPQSRDNQPDYLRERISEPEKLVKEVRCSPVSRQFFG